MSAQKKFGFFFSVVFILLFATIVTSYMLYKKRQMAHLKNEYQKKEYNADIAIKLQSKPMLKTTLDYTLWDEMLNFIKHPNALWAKDNIDPLPQTIGINYIWIYNLSGDKVYELKDPLSPAFSNPFPTKIIHRILDNTAHKVNKSYSFFSKINNQIVEISGASVHSTYDFQRIKKTGGYFYIGRILKKDYFDELGIITDSHATLASDTIHKNDTGSQQITIYKNLYDWNNKALATIKFSSNDQFMQEEDSFNRYSIIIYTFVIGLIIISLFFYLKIQITNPLTAISKSLNTEDKSNIEHLISKTDELGQVARLINNFFDQKKLLENDYSALIEHTNSLVCEVNDKGFLTFLSPASILVLGYEPKELIGKNIFDLMPDKERRRLSKYFIRQSPGSSVRHICNFKHGNGTWRWLELSATYYEQEPGDLRIVTIVTDITERKLAEDALYRSEEEYRTLLNAIPDLFFRIRKDGLILNFKAPDESILYASPHDFLGKNVKDILPAEVTTLLFEQIDKRFQTNEICTFDYELLIKNELHYYEARIVTSSANEIFTIIRDITKRKKAENTLKENEKQLSEANHTKDKFFSIIAHDLKGPLTSLLGLTEQIVENFESFERNNIKKYFQLIHKSSQNSYRLLENLLEWARSQTGKIEYQPIIMDLHSIINENIALVEDLASQKYIKIKTTIGNNCPIFGDRQMINSILRNLLVNAIKFTPQKGLITVSAVEQIDYFEISVKDNGVGISKEGLNKLFRLDSKYSTLGTDDEQGTGLGLILCKEFIEKNGGKIWVESEPNKGSDFKFTLLKVGVANMC